MDGSFWDAVCAWSRRKSGEPALLGLPGRAALPWDALPDGVEVLAMALRGAGVTEASRVALLMPPGAETVLLCLAVMRVGIAVPLDPESTSAEIASALDRDRPHLLVVSEGLPGDASAVAAARGVPTVWAHWDRSARAGTVHLDAPNRGAFPPMPDDVLTAPVGTRMILRTSGTTAHPKLVPLTAENLHLSARALVASLRLTEADRGLNLLPQFHIGGLWDLVAGPLLSGGSVICAGAFSPAAYARGLSLAPTWVQLVPAMIGAVLREREEGRVGPPPATMRLLRSVSAALPPALKARAEASLGVTVVEIYGMTEAAGVIASNPLDPGLQKPGTVGPSVGPEMTIRAPSGVEQPRGEVGEVVLRGPQISPGYLAVAPGDAVAFAPDGFHTGDLGSLDADGHLRLVGRLKDLINRGGEKVAPAEIETALLTLPWIADAAAFGVPHPELGEEIEAAIVPVEGAAPGGDPLGTTLAALRPVLGHGRVPARLHRVEAIPRTPGGKLRRAALRDGLLDAPAAPVAAPITAPASASSEAGPLARWIAGIWASALGRAAIGPDDDFFALGGTSLRAAQAVALIQDRFPDEIVYVSSVYEAPTPERQAAFLHRHHPRIAMGILGEYVRARSVGAAPVDVDMRAAFHAAIAPAQPVAADASARRNPPAVIILSPPRSGSTLLRAMLAGHSRLFAPPELYLLSHADLAARRAWYGAAHASQLEGLPRAFMGALGWSADEAETRVAAMEAEVEGTAQVYRRLQDAVPGRMLVDKTPYYGVHTEVLARSEAVFDRPLYIHLSRHPYGMIRSFEAASLAQLWWPRLTGPGGGPCPFHPRQFGELLWERIHATAATFLETMPAERWIHLRFEDLVAAPETACRRLCDALAIPFEPSMLDPLSDPARRMTDGLRPGSRMIGDPKFHAHRGIEGDAAGAWRRHYERDFLSDETWALAATLGYRERIADRSERVVFEI